MLRFVLVLAVASLFSLVLLSSTTAQTIAPNGTMRLNFIQYGPFQARQEAGSAVWTKSLTFQSVRTNSQQTWQPPFIVMYGGERLNDVWITSDSGTTWELVSGRAVNYTSAVPMNGLNDQSRTADCGDADNLYLVGGTAQAAVGHSSNVSRSTNIINWQQYPNQAFYGRQRSTCAVNKQGALFVFGGLTTGSQRGNGSTDTNDIWVSRSQGTGWTKVTEYSRWYRRQGQNSEFVTTPMPGNTEVLYLMNGYRGGVDRRWNDIWVSTDNAVTFERLNPAATYDGRMDAQLSVTSNGVMVVSGGDCGNFCNKNDVWASLDGGYTWGVCCAGANCGYQVREDHVQEIDKNGRLLLWSGSRQNPGLGNINDVWLSDITFTDPAAVARACGLKVPAAGVGLRCLPSGYCPTNPLGNAQGRGLVMQRMKDAPWSPRFEGGMAMYPKTLSFLPSDSTTRKTLTNPLIMYGGRGSYSSVGVYNDVWALDANTDTWWLIGGVTPDGVSSKYTNAPLQDQGRTADCYDNQGRMYSIAGTGSDGVKNSRVYMSADGGLNWRMQTMAAPFVGREAAACATGSDGRVWVMAGALDDNDVDYLGDVWESRNSGVGWTRMTGNAPWSTRTQADADCLQNSTLFNGADILYIANGYDGHKWPGNRQNDVWASSNGGRNWAVITANAPYRGRQDGQLIITPTGAMLTVAGDAGINEPGNFNDIWASLDGGYSWGLCNLTAGFSPREDHVAIMDARGFLWVTQGEAPDQNGIRNDVWKSTVSLASDTQIQSLCQVRMPSCGVGLRCWPTDKSCQLNNRCPVESDDGGGGGGGGDDGGGGDYSGSTGAAAGGSGGLSGGIIALIAIVIVAVAGGAVFLYYRYFMAQPATKDTLHTELIGQHGSTNGMNGHTDTANGNYHPLDIGHGGVTTGAAL